MKVVGARPATETHPSHPSIVTWPSLRAPHEPSPQTFWAEVEPQTEWGSSYQVLKRRENFHVEVETFSIAACRRPAQKWEEKAYMSLIWKRRGYY
jgi:hypothetical protein